VEGEERKEDKRTAEERFIGAESSNAPAMSLAGLAAYRCFGEVKSDSKGN